MPRISVVIPTFNCARYLRRTIDSALCQTYTDCEIVVVDDGSTDETKEIVHSYRQPIRYLYQSNAGASAARNLALEHASGEFIAYLDADDMWHPQKLERQVAFLDTHKECGLVHSEVNVIDEEDKITYERFNAETQRPVPEGYCLHDLLRRSHIQTLTVVERRKCFDRVGLFDRRLRIAQDYLHWIMVSVEGMAVGYLPEPLGQYRWRQGSLMASQKRLFEDYVMICKILLEEKSLARRCGQDSADIVYDRLYSVQRELAYLERIEGECKSARQRIGSLIKQRPFRAELYLDLLKALCTSVAHWTVETS